MNALAERDVEKPGSGYYLLTMLSRSGWRVEVVANGKGGVLVNASRLGRETITVEGESVAAGVALEVWRQALDQEHRAR